jgi:hypothetical protein
MLGEGGMCDKDLYTSVEEQADALSGAGFTQIDCCLLKGGLVLHRSV